MDAEGAPESIAAQRRAWLARSYREEVEDLIASVADETGPFHDDLTTAMADPDAEQLFAAGGLTPALWPMVRETLPTDPPPHRDLDALHVCDVAQDHVNAVCGIYDDGSGLVVVSDALLSLISFLSQATSYCLNMTGGPLGWTRLIRTVVRNRRGVLSDRQQVVIALTRYNLIQQRCFGVRGRISVRQDDRSENQAAVLAHHAMWFVLAHEAGHFALGHPPSSLTSVGGAELPAAPAETDLELAADEYGYAATLREALSTPSIDASGMAPIGAALALLAVELTERALFVRLPRTHPSSDARWAHLARMMDATAARTAQDVVALIRTPILLAIDAPPIPAEVWARTFSRRDVPVMSHNETARQYTPNLDIALHGPIPEPTRIARVDPGAATLCEDALRIDGDEDLRRFLDRTGMDAEAVAEALDPTVGVTFRTLLAWLETSSTFADLRSREARLVIGCALARILAPHLAQVGR